MASRRRAWAAVAVVAVNAGLLSTHLYLRHRSAAPRDLPLGLRIEPAGVALDGSSVSGGGGHPCHLLRFESRRCSYCQADRERFEALSREAAGESCSVTIVAPHPHDLFEDGGAPAGTRLAYPTVAFARSFPASGTPTTLVTGADGRVLWTRTGALQDGDAERALSSLRRRTAER
jgi:hypothetical protein